ncbi:MAG TPA: homocysteine S-methyltransferase [Caldilinea sp.]|nr:homocysteine S-methyltransferase [Caldilinea sp.]
MHDPLQEILERQGVVIIDGALATELERRGADLRDALWSARLLLDAPDLIRGVHLDYLRAGADVLITASYQASYAGFARRGLDAAAVDDLFRRSVTLAADARDEFWAAAANRTGRVRPLVAASVGPYGAFLADGSEYRGDYGLSVAELMAWHRPRMAVLAAAGADLFALETIPCLAEVEALAALLAEFPHMQAWLACSCRDGAALSSGEPMAAAARLAAQTGQIVAVGVNCTAPRYVEDLLAAARGGTAKPLLCYPNSGEAWDAAARCWVEGSGVTGFAEPARRWVAAGARLIGGCCRTTPADIAVIAQALRGPGPR